MSLLLIVSTKLVRLGLRGKGTKGHGDKGNRKLKKRIRKFEGEGSLCYLNTIATCFIPRM